MADTSWVMEDFQRRAEELRRLQARNDLLQGRIEAALGLFARERTAHREGLPVDWRWLATEMAKALAPDGEATQAGQR